MNVLVMKMKIWKSPPESYGIFENTLFKLFLNLCCTEILHLHLGNNSRGIRLKKSNDEFSGVTKVNTRRKLLASNHLTGSYSADAGPPGSIFAHGTTEHSQPIT